MFTQTGVQSTSRGAHDNDELRQKLYEKIGQILLHKGTLLQQEGNLDDALELYVNSVARYQRLALVDSPGIDFVLTGFHLNRGNTLRMLNRGNTLRMKEALDDALVAYAQAETLFEGSSLKSHPLRDLRMTRLYKVKADVLASKGQLDDAIPLYRQALSLYDKPPLRDQHDLDIRDQHDLDIHRARTNVNLGQALQEKGAWDEAFEAFFQAQAIFDQPSLKEIRELDAERVDLQLDRANTLDAKGSALLETAPNQALVMFQEGLDVLAASNQQSNPNIDVGRARLHMLCAKAQQMLG